MAALPLCLQWTAFTCHAAWVRPEGLPSRGTSRHSRTGQGSAPCTAPRGWRVVCSGQGARPLPSVASAGTGLGAVGSKVLGAPPDVLSSAAV
eukprot:CAMPEP_0204561222 /NCGR_PEP_ID=MMETSP0661-20131031/33068_1 /ASSEMBLY_ACC=CAM_ASM_000606 /TAXON_ID=109239 /ORGANISM="Alexandrium margalefi, Strain AMGDE01CS-322" /LENGTH=91 /DNA_ID=CAMNT_0051568623 /DNA_START=50 /DNA_END=322 /DNA_ORIENTATION=+